MEISSCVKAVSIAANQYSNNRSSSNMGYLLHQLEILQTVSARTESLKPLRPNEMLTFECLSCLTEIIGNASYKPGLVLQCLHILTNLAKDLELCHMIKESFNMDHTLAGVIKTYGGSPDDQLTHVCLKLLQRLTYGHRISFHESFVDDLLKYLVNQILSPASAVTQSSLGVLANLCHDNFPIQARIKSMDVLKRLMRTVSKFFTDEDYNTAIFSLSIFTSLSLSEDSDNEAFFNRQNMEQVLRLVFNVLLNGEGSTARTYAIDLLQELIRNPRLQQAIVEHPNLSRCIEDTLKLICTSSVSTVAKVFDLLIAFCSLGSLRSCVCGRLFDAQLVTPKQLKGFLNNAPPPDCQPLVAALCWATAPTAIPCRASLTALEFLKEMYEEILCGDDQDLKSSVCMVLPALVNILQEPITVDMSHMTHICKRLSATLSLLTVMCGEDELKASVAESLNTEVLSSLVRFHLNSHKAVQKQLPALKGLGQGQDWGPASVEVVLLAMQLMSRIRRYVAGLDDLFQQLLQDNDLVPFLAKGWTSRERDQVQIALQLTCLGFSLDNFPDIILGDAVAAANASLLHAVTGPGGEGMGDVSMASSHGRYGGDNKENVPLRSRPPTSDLSLQSVQSADDTIQSLIEKMHSSMELKDLKTADIIEIYEHRLQSHQTKEDHLQDLLEAKSLALTQADRLISQYRSRQARHGAEAHKMRCLFQEAERKNDGLLQEMNEIKLNKDRLKNEYDLLRHEKNQLELKALELEELKATHAEMCDECEKLTANVTRLQQELKTTQEMHEMLEKHYESLKHQHDVASEQLKKLEEERKQLSRTLKDKEAKLNETTKALQALTDKHSGLLKDREELELERETLEKGVDRLRVHTSQLEQTNKELSLKVKSLERLTQEQEEELKVTQDKITHLEAEVSKHAQIASLIHSLSSGQTNPGEIKPGNK